MPINYEVAYKALLERFSDLEREAKNLRTALRPFAALLQDHNREGPDDRPIFAINDALITLGNLRLARLSNDAAWQREVAALAQQREHEQLIDDLIGKDCGS